MRSGVFAILMMALLVQVFGCTRQPVDEQAVKPRQSVPSRDEIAVHVSYEGGVDDFQKIYWGYLPNKAFASSPDGAYGYSGERMSTPKHAAESALRYCEQAREERRLIAPCKVVNINGEWQF